MKILLINPFDRNALPISPWPQLGLTIMATRARDMGHETLVADYAFHPRTTPLSQLVPAFSPDVVGVTLYTAQMSQARKTIREIRGLCAAPLCLGGPHATLYAEKIAAENVADYIFRGECDLLFAEEAEKLRRRKDSAVLSASPPDIDNIPEPDFGLALGSSDMTYYPIQLSRGCPYDCSFCSVKLISTTRVRFKGLERGLDEIELACARLHKIRSIRIVDDCPTFQPARFKAFLKGYLQRGIRKPLHIDNLRADGVDNEMLDLIASIGVDHLCIGVESGNPEVFDLINKGEKMEDIIQAARLIKRHGIRLYLCFVIGLPGATASSEMDSIRLARSLRPNWIYWNLFQPHRGTRASAWFETHGRIDDEEDKSSLIGLNLDTTDAPCEIAEFLSGERKRVHLMASLLSGAYWLHPRYFGRYAQIIAKNGLGRAFLRGLPAALRINLEMLLHRIRRCLKSSRLLSRGTRRCV